MKYKYLIFCISLIFIGCKNTNQIQVTSSPRVVHQPYHVSDRPMYKIKKITPYKSAYIIEAERENLTYFIITQNDNNINLRCNKAITEGGSYLLTLKMLYPKYEGGETFGKALGGYMSGVYYNGTTIPLNEFNGICYTTSSLVGLCFSKDYNFEKTSPL